jgi:hypothetical protein
MVGIIQYLQNNGSLYGHFFLAKDGVVPGLGNYSSESILYHRKLLTRFMKKRVLSKKKNLISGADNKDEETISENSDLSSPAQIVSHWWPK